MVFFGRGGGSADFIFYGREDFSDFLNPNPHIQGKNMNRIMTPKLPDFPCFQAFGVIFCPDVSSYFCLVCGGRGSPANSERRCALSGCKWHTFSGDFSEIWSVTKLCWGQKHSCKRLSQEGHKEVTGGGGLRLEGIVTMIVCCREGLAAIASHNGPLKPCTP